MTSFKERKAVKELDSSIVTHDTVIEKLKQMNKLLNLKTWLSQWLRICLDLTHTKDLFNIFKRGIV